MNEHAIQKQIAQILRLKGWTVICTDVMAALGYISGPKRFAFIRHYKDAGYTKGQPDLIAFKNKKIVFIEVKKPKAKQSPDQIKFQKAVNENGFEYAVVRDVDEVGGW